MRSQPARPLHWIGDPDPHGRALVLLHGAGGHHGLWLPVWRELRARGVPALAVDLPGHGGSAPPPEWTVEGLADAVARGLREGGLAAWVVAGHSLGGAVALTLGASGDPAVLGLGAVATGARLGVNPAILEGIRTAFEVTVDRIARWCYPKGTPEGVWKEAAATLAAAGPGVLWNDFEACRRYGLSPEALGRIAVPTAVVCGDRDVMTPPELSRELAEAIPRAGLRLVPGAGHMVILEAPGAVAEALAELWKRAVG
ncbi:MULTISPECIES: alpha/beta fold hydrolase [Deferrisoma]